MRTTIELPTPLFRTLKSRAALRGQTLAAVVRELIERGLSQSESTTMAEKIRLGHRNPPPRFEVLQGVTIPALTSADLAGMEDEEDEARHARSTGR